MAPARPKGAKDEQKKGDRERSPLEKSSPEMGALQAPPHEYKERRKEQQRHIFDGHPQHQRHNGPGIARPLPSQEAQKNEKDHQKIIVPHGMRLEEDKGIPCKEEESGQSLLGRPLAQEQGENDKTAQITAEIKRTAPGSQ